MILRDLLTGPKLIILIVLVAVGGMTISTLALLVYVRNGCGEKLGQSAPPYALEAIETITAWEDEAVIDLMPPLARDQQQLISSVRNTCDSLRTALGTRTRPVELRGHAAGHFSLRQKAYAVGRYSSRCTFEKGSVIISVEVMKDLKIAGTNGPWQLVNISYSGIDN